MKADKFEINDKVWDIRYGWGYVSKIGNDVFSVCVLFKNTKTATYTTDGKSALDFNRTLFFEEIKIPESAYKRPKWRADTNNIYYYINASGDFAFMSESGNDYDNKKFNIGNYFKTEEEAKESKFYKVFHEEE